MAEEEIPGRFLLTGFLRKTFRPPVAFSFGTTMALVATVLIWGAVKEGERREDEE